MTRPATDPIAERYRRFATEQAPGISPSFEAWSHAVAGDRAVLERLATLPESKQQPNLVFAALRWHGATPGDAASLRDGLLGRWAEVGATIRTRSTQTNEAARCAVLLPLLHRIGGPLALLELGAAAGLCLIPDRYGYRYSDGTTIAPRTGPGGLTIECRVAGGELPPGLAAPDVVSRAGIDRNPLDPADPDVVAWLTTLVWPEHEHRRQRLPVALRLAAGADLRVERGDLTDGLAERLRAFVAGQPAGVTPVVVHSLTLAYLGDEERAGVVSAICASGARWISLEGRDVVPGVVAPGAATPATQVVAALDGVPVALTEGHGTSVTLL